MIENFIVSLIIIVLNFFVAFILRAIHKTWLAPSAIYALWWSLTGLVSIIAGYNEKVPVSGLGWILLSSILIGVGSLVFLPNNFKILQAEELVLDDRSFSDKIGKLNKLYIITLFLAFAYILASLVYQQTSFSDLTSLEGFLLLAAKFSQDRYEDTTVLPIYIKLLLPFIFLATCIGGIMFGITKQKRYLICLLPPVIISILFTEKAGIFFCFSMWMSSYMSIMLFKKKLVIFDWATIVKTMGITIVISAILVFSSFARLGVLDVAELGVVWDKLYSTLFGHIPAFSNWFATYDFSHETPEFGKYTFSGVFDFFGLSKRESGLYTVNYQLSNGELTNLYSIHKGLILDFTASGSLFLYFIFGMVGSFVFYSVYKNAGKLIGLLSSVYAITFVSIFYSVFIFNTTFLAIFLTILFLFLI